MDSARPAEAIMDDWAQVVAQALSGAGGVLAKIPSIHSRLAGETVAGPGAWFVPVNTTEATPRLVSRRVASGEATHLVIWDERFFHHLARLIEAHEAWLRTRADWARAERAFAAIAWDFVLEQLCPANRAALRAPDPRRAERVLSRIFARRETERPPDARILEELVKAPAVRDPKVGELLGDLYRLCRQLALEHEAHHYLRRHAAAWDAASRVSTAGMEANLFDLLAGFDKAVVTGILPPGRIWPFLEGIVAQIPMGLLRQDFEGTPRGEEIMSDLVPVLLLCTKTEADLAGLSEAQEFKALATFYQACRLWQIGSAFLQGLRLEVGRALGVALRDPTFREGDLGLRLMLGNFLSYRLLTNPPYASRRVVDRELEPAFVQEVAKIRNLARAYSVRKSQGAQATARLHRALFLDNYERSFHAWLRMLNTVGLEIADGLAAAAGPEGPVPAKPSLARLLDFVDFPDPVAPRRSTAG